MELIGFSIDKLTILGDAVEHLVESLTFNPMVVSRKMAQYPYKYQWYMIDGSLLQLAEKNADIPDLRYEFNPKHWDTPYDKDYDITFNSERFGRLTLDGDISSKNSNIMSILRLIKSPRLSRIDVAMDFKGLDFSKVKITDKNPRTEVQWRGKDKSIETYYFGTRRSDSFLRIYNKARQEGKAHYSDTDWWRCEAQINAKMAEDFDKFNPWEDIVITYVDDGLVDGENITTKAMLFYLRANPEAINELSINVRTKYKKLLLESSKQIEVSLADIYEQKKVTLIKEVTMWKSLTAKIETINWDKVKTDGVQDIYTMTMLEKTS